MGGILQALAPLYDPSKAFDPAAWATLGRGALSAARSGLGALSLESILGGLPPTPQVEQPRFVSPTSTLGRIGEALKPENYGMTGALTGMIGGALEGGEPELLEGMAPEIAPVKTRDVKARSIEDLDQRIPQQMRTVSPDPTKTVTGGRFSDLDLDKPGVGFLPYRQFGPEVAEQMNQKAWNDAINESEIGGGTAARDAVKKTGMRPPTAAFLNDAFSLPDRSRYWYEVSGEGMTGQHINVAREYQPTVIDAVAGTSGGVEPYDNMKRALGILSEDRQKLPVMTDLRDPASARVALSPDPARSLKYRQFGGTMKYTTGLSDYAPTSTNDVQVADILGGSGEDFPKHPVMYEVTSRYITKLRDLQNQLSEAGAQPWETWQVQAPPWVYNRALKNPAKASEYDDYSLVLPQIIREFQEAGIPTPGGKITEATLDDPRTPNLMSGTREHFLATPTATVEVASRLTPGGQAAADLHDQLMRIPPENREAWMNNALDEHEQNQRNAMRALMSRKGANKETGAPAEDSLMSQLASEIVGRRIDISRMERTGYGTFNPGGGPQYEINPNLRVPMTGRAGQKWFDLNPVQREAFLSMLGQDLQQEGMVSSLFDTVPSNAPSLTHSVFLRRTDGVIDKQAIQNFSNMLGHPVNVSQVPNGVLIDVNPNWTGSGYVGPGKEAFENAVHANFGNDANVQDIVGFNRNYENNYVDQADYEGKINAWRQQAANDYAAATQAKVGRARGARPPWNPEERVGNLAGVRQKIQAVAKARDAKNAEWAQQYGARLQKHVGTKRRLAEALPGPVPPGMAQGGLFQHLPREGLYQRMRANMLDSLKAPRSAERRGA